MRKVLSTVAAALIGGASVLSAQTDEAAYLGIESTPLGSLPARLSPAMMSQKAKMAFSASYGYLGYDGRDKVSNFGASVDMPWRSSRVGVTVGYSKPDCPPADCEGHLMVAGNWGRRVTSVNLGSGADAARLNLGFETDINYGMPEDASALSASVGLPIAFVPQHNGVQFVPFVAPRFAIGRYRITDLGGDTGTSLMLGGGFAVNGLFDQIGLNFGFQKVFIDGTPTQYGVGVTYRQK